MQLRGLGEAALAITQQPRPAVHDRRHLRESGGPCPTPHGVDDRSFRGAVVASGDCDEHRKPPSFELHVFERGHVGEDGFSVGVAPAVRGESGPAETFEVGQPIAAALDATELEEDALDELGRLGGERYVDPVRQQRQLVDALLPGGDKPLSEHGGRLTQLPG